MTSQIAVCHLLLLPLNTQPLPLCVTPKMSRLFHSGEREMKLILVVPAVPWPSAVSSETRHGKRIFSSSNITLFIRAPCPPGDRATRRRLRGPREGCHRAERFPPPLLAAIFGAVTRCRCSSPQTPQPAPSLSSPFLLQPFPPRDSFPLTPPISPRIKTCPLDAVPLHVAL